MKSQGLDAATGGSVNGAMRRLGAPCKPQSLKPPAGTSRDDRHRKTSHENALFAEPDAASIGLRHVARGAKWPTRSSLCGDR